MKYLLIITTLSLLTACTQAPPQFDEKVRTTVRLTVFKECMELASRNGRQGDDDVSDIVKACDSTAYYQSNQASQIVR